MRYVMSLCCVLVAVGCVPHVNDGSHARGCYSRDDCPEDDICFFGTCQGPGFNIQSVHLDLMPSTATGYLQQADADNPRDLAHGELVVRVREAAALRGRLVSDAASLGGVITAQAHRGDGDAVVLPSSQATQQTVVGPDQTFSLALLPGMYDLTAQPSYAQASSLPPLTVERYAVPAGAGSAGTDTPLELQYPMRTLQALTGRIVADANGNVPIGGARVTGTAIDGRGNKLLAAPAQTDVNGRYTLHHLPGATALTVITAAGDNPWVPAMTFNVAVNTQPLPHNSGQTSDTNPANEGGSSRQKGLASGRTFAREVEQPGWISPANVEPDQGSRAANQGSRGADQDSRAANQGSRGADQDSRAADKGSREADQGSRAPDQGKQADELLDLGTQVLNIDADAVTNVQLLVLDTLGRAVPGATLQFQGAVGSAGETLAHTSKAAGFVPTPTTDIATPQRRVFAEHRGHFRTSALTDAEGAAQAVLLPGVYRLLVLPGQGPQGVAARSIEHVCVGVSETPADGSALTLSHDTAVPLTLPVQIEATGIVTDHTGKPLGGARVEYATAVDAARRRVFAVHTDANGAYSVQLDPGSPGVPRDYELSVEPSTSSAVPRHRELLRVGDGPVVHDVHIYPPAFVYGTVVDPNGAGLSDVTIALYSTELGSAGQPLLIGLGKSVSGGEFAIPIPTANGGD